MLFQTVRKTPQYINVKEYLEFQTHADEISNPYGIKYGLVKQYESGQYYWDIEESDMQLKGYLLAIDVGGGVLMYKLIAEQRFFKTDSEILENVKKSLSFGAASHNKNKQATQKDAREL